MMEASRIKIKDSIFVLKDAVARDLANEAIGTANTAATNVASAITDAQEAMTAANTADAKAEQALNRAIPSKVSELTNDAGYVTASYDEATEAVVFSISNKE